MSTRRTGWAIAGKDIAKWSCSGVSDKTGVDILGCGSPIMLGDPVYFGPGGGEILCHSCAQKAADAGKLPPLPPLLPSFDIETPSGPDLSGWSWQPISDFPNYVCQFFEAACCIKLTKVGSKVAFAPTDENSQAYFNGDVLCVNCAAKLGYFPPSGAGEAEVKSMPTKSSKPKICLGCTQHICNVCSVCHTAECIYAEYQVTTPALATKYSHLRATTQKARGYVALAETSLPMPKPFGIIVDDSDVEGTLEVFKAYDKAFVRPCPTRPRHGFVDSRPVELKQEGIAEKVRALLRLAKDADESGRAELLVVPYIESAYNAIITPSRVAIGTGHDGATAGHDSMIFPLAGVPFYELNESVLYKSRVAPDEDPYIEAVVPGGGVGLFTQLRAGVKIPASVGADFVPRRMRVAEVIDASGDLLEWEAQTKRIGEGTVVCHVGGSLISHYGVHCMYNNIAVFTSRRPEVGEILEVAGRAEKPNPDDVVRGLAAGVLVPTYTGKGSIDIKDCLTAMMVTLHNSAAMAGPDGFWIGVAVSIMLRAGMAASHGESRHKSAQKHLGRSQVYKLAFVDYFACRNNIGAVQWGFINKTWPSGFGGKAWAKCTEAVIGLDRAAQKLINEPAESNVAELVTRLNDAVNQAHNGGWWLNKFIAQTEFTEASRQSLPSVLRAAVAMYKMRQAVQNEALHEVIEKWKAAPEIVVKNGRLLCELRQSEIAEAKAVEFVGAACEECGEEYDPDNFTADQLQKGYVTCGKDGCEGSVKGVVGVSGVDDSDDLDYAPEVYPDLPSAPTINLGEFGKQPDADAQVSVVQANLHNGKPNDYLHFQFRLAGEIGYYSFNALVPSGCHIDMIKYVAQPQLDSFSGSKVNNYVAFAAKQVGGSIWMFENAALGLACQLDITLVGTVALNGLMMTQVKADGLDVIAEVKDEPQAQAEEGQEEGSKVELDGVVDDIPF